MKAEDYLASVAHTREEVDRFVEKVSNPGDLSKNYGWTFDDDLGLVLVDSVRQDGIDKSKTFYHYEADRARWSIQFRDRLCRVHTYGNSFTHCDQVSDAETWQEYLAGHLQEPIRNYGIGGYGVYQAYRRMRKIEAVVPAEHILLNIWDDDHFRNLDSWRTIRFGHKTYCGYTLPHVRVNVKKNEFLEIENPIRSAKDVYKLCDVDFLVKTFRDDPVLQVVMANKETKAVPPELVQPVAVSFGLPPDQVAGGEAGDQIRRLHAEAALFATRRIVEMTERFCQETGRKLMVILSHSSGGIKDALLGKPRWDRTFLDFMKTRKFPWMDLRASHLAEFSASKEDADTYIKRYYIGHYNPAGNFFFAMALRKMMAEWLDPKPLPYR